MALWRWARADPFPARHHDIPPPPAVPVQGYRPTVHAWGEYEGGRCALSLFEENGYLTVLEIYDGDHAGARCLVEANLSPAHQVALSRVLGLWATDPGDVAARWELERFADEPIRHLQVTGDREVLRLGLDPHTVRLPRHQAVALRDALETSIHRP